MARHAAVDLGLSLGLALKDPERLPAAAQEALFMLLTGSGMPMDTSPEAHRHLRELRALYEPHVAALSGWLDLPLPTLPPNPAAHDHWRMSTDPDGHFFSVG